MQKAIPTPDMGRRLMDEARVRCMADPATAVIFAHNGAMDNDVLAELLRKVEGSSLSAEEGQMVRKRLVNIMMEALDNMHRHALAILRDASFALLVRDPKGYVLTTGNAVPAATAILLAHRVEILNAMDPSDLKEHFLKIFKNEARSANGGAGLGLLTIARKSAAPIVTRASSLGPFTSFLTFEVRVDRPDVQA